MVSAAGLDGEVRGILMVGCLYPPLNTDHTLLYTARRLGIEFYSIMLYRNTRAGGAPTRHPRRTHKLTTDPLERKHTAHVWSAPCVLYTR